MAHIFSNQSVFFPLAFCLAAGIHPLSFVQQRSHSSLLGSADSSPRHNCHSFPVTRHGWSELRYTTPHWTWHPITSSAHCALGEFHQIIKLDRVVAVIRLPAYWTKISLLRAVNSGFYTTLGFFRLCDMHEMNSLFTVSLWLAYIIKGVKLWAIATVQPSK